MPSRQRKGWDFLSPSYRQRLGRAGISQRDYERGVSLSGARGHSATPERPQRALSNPTRYREYITRRDLTVPAGTGVDNDNVQTILGDIHDASSYEALHGLRRAVESQNGPTKVRLAVDLGVENSIPAFSRFNHSEQVQVAQVWLRAFMTHARAQDDPTLAGERIVLTGGRHGGHSGILPDLYRKYNIPQDSKSFWTEFKRAYHQFFTNNQLPGV